MASWVALVGCRWSPYRRPFFAWEPQPKKKPGMEMDVRIPGPQEFWLLRLNAYPHESHPNILVVLEFFSHLAFSGCFVWVSMWRNVDPQNTQVNVAKRGAKVACCHWCNLLAPCQLWRPSSRASRCRVTQRKRGENMMKTIHKTC